MEKKESVCVCVGVCGRGTADASGSAALIAMEEVTDAVDIVIIITATITNRSCGVVAVVCRLLSPVIDFRLTGSS